MIKKQKTDNKIKIKKKQTKHKHPGYSMLCNEDYGKHYCELLGNNQ